MAEQEKVDKKDKDKEPGPSLVNRFAAFNRRVNHFLVDAKWVVGPWCLAYGTHLVMADKWNPSANPLVLLFGTLFAWLTGWWMGSFAVSVLAWIVVPVLLCVAGSILSDTVKDVVLTATDAIPKYRFESNWVERIKSIAAVTKTLNGPLSPQLVSVRFLDHVTVVTVWAEWRRRNKQSAWHAFLPDRLEVVFRPTSAQAVHADKWADLIATAFQDLLGYADSEKEFITKSGTNAWRVTFTRYELHTIYEVGTQAQVDASHQARVERAEFERKPEPDYPVIITPDQVDIGEDHVALYVDVSGSIEGHDLSVNPHGMSAGTTDSGKSSPFRCWTAHALQHDWPLVTIDFKSGGGGLDVQPLIGQVPVLGVNDTDQIRGLLQWVLGDFGEARRELLLDHNVRNWAELPPAVRLTPEGRRFVILSDESPVAFLNIPEIGELYRKIAQESRVFGIHCIHTGQRPTGKDAYGKIGQGILANLNGRTMFGPTDATVESWFLGGAAPESVIGQHKVHQTVKGRAIAYGLNENCVVPKNVQILWYSDPALADLVAGYAPEWPEGMPISLTNAAPAETQAKPEPAPEPVLVPEREPIPMGPAKLTLIQNEDKDRGREPRPDVRPDPRVDLDGARQWAARNR